MPPTNAQRADNDEPEQSQGSGRRPVDTAKRHDLLDLAEAASEAATKIRDLSRGRSQGR